MSERIPTVEDRLEEVRHALALGILVTRAVARSDDLMLSSHETDDAYTRLSVVFADAQRSAQSILEALGADCQKPARQHHLAGGARAPRGGDVG